MLPLLLVATPLVVAAPSAARAAACWRNPAAGAFIAAARSHIENACPCAAATSRSTYLRCARGVVKTAVASGALPKTCASVVKKAASRATCGTPGATTCCAPDAEGPSCSVTTACDTGDGVTTLGATASCHDACGAVCGNGLIEDGEQCDDRNGVPGDGCSAACRLELPAGCTAVTVAEYRGAFPDDASLETVLGNASDLGFTSPLVFPSRCTNGTVTFYAAALFSATGAQATLASRVGAPLPVRHVLRRPLGGNRLEMVLESGVLRFDGTADPSRPELTVETLYTEDAEAPAATAEGRAGVGGGLYPDPCDVATCATRFNAYFACVRTRELPCLAAIGLEIACNLFPNPIVKFGCVIAGLFGGLGCEAILTDDCPYPAGSACSTNFCIEGECAIRRAHVPRGLVTMVGCRPTGGSSCADCDSCNSNGCCTGGTSQSCCDHRASSGRFRVASAKVPPQFEYCEAPRHSVCNNAPHCVAGAIAYLDYYNCRGDFIGMCTGSDGLYDTCGLKCGEGNPRCDAAVSTTVAWEGIRAQTQCHQIPPGHGGFEGYPVVDGPLDEGTVLFFAPSDQACCVTP